MDTTRTAALYVRVSTEKQFTENQLPELQRLARARGWEVTQVFQETVSGAGRTRPEFDRMMDGARRGEFQVVAVWSMDRFGRSMVGNLTAVLELDRLGVHVVSIRESWLDTSAGPVRQLLIGIFGWVAEQEKIQLASRVRVGLDRVRAKGVRLGRPRAQIDLRQARQLREEGFSLRVIARKMKCSPSALHRALVPTCPRIPPPPMVA